MKKRFLSLLLALMLSAGTVPAASLPVSAEDDFGEISFGTNYIEVQDSYTASKERASSPSRILSKAQLAYGGVDVVPVSLRFNEAFMNAYVYNSNQLSLNGSFVKVDGSNHKPQKGTTLPTGTIQGKKDGKWWVTYQWTPTEEQKAAIERGELHFETNMISDEHRHYNWGKVRYDYEFSYAGCRLTLPEADGSNSWVYGENDYGYKPNGIRILYDESRDTETPRLLSQWWDSVPFDDSVYLNMYQSWAKDCGSASLSGTVFYITGGDWPEIRGITHTAERYQGLEQDPDNNTKYQITVHFDREIRFADNKPHDDIKLLLDAEYLEQSGMEGNFTIQADFVAMDERSMTFEYEVDEKWKHFQITGISYDQEDLYKETELKVFDSKGNPLDKVDHLTVNSLITDIYGCPMEYWGWGFGPLVFDGVSPTLTKVSMGGSSITVNPEEPDNWNYNSGSNADIYAGTDGDNYNFTLYFNESIQVQNQYDARAVLSITDAYGDPLKLKISEVTDKSIVFENIMIDEGMLNPGERILIEEFENLTVTDKVGNMLTNKMTGDAIVPAQEIMLDVDAPVILSSGTLEEDIEGGRFSYPVEFSDADITAYQSGMEGAETSFRLVMPDHEEYPYRWYLDTNPAISSNAKWQPGVTGSDNAFGIELTSGLEYWIHFELDPNRDYGYTIVSDGEVPGIYFNGTLIVNGITDWAGNTGADAEYSLTLQVDKTAPESEITSALLKTADFANDSVEFDGSVGASDNYSVSEVYYQWEIAVGGDEFEPVGEVQTIEVTDSGMNKKVSCDVDSYIYEYDSIDEETKYGRVRLRTWAKDTAGYTGFEVYTDEISFDYRKAVNNSYVEVNDASHPTNLPKVHMMAPETIGDTANESISLLIIPDVNSTNGSGEYTKFWIYLPASSDNFYADPIKKYLDYDYSNFANLWLYNGWLCYADGSVDVETATGTFENIRLLNAAFSDDAPDEEKEANEMLMASLRDYLYNYYGRMELYTVTTSSISDYDESIDFVEADSVLDTFTVYLKNAVEYSLSDLKIVNEKGLTDRELERGEAKLDYVSGEGRPGRTNLDGVSVSIRLNNDTDETSVGGVRYALDYIDFDNSTIKLFKTSGRKTNYSSLKNELKTWYLHNSSDGMNTIVFENGLCKENGWYTLAISVEDTEGNVVIEEILGNFFMDATTLDIEAGDFRKSYSSTKSSYDDIVWELKDIEKAYRDGEEIRIGLAPMPEDWEPDNDGNYITFNSFGRPNSPNDDGDETDDLAEIRVYNQTYNMRAGLAADTGLWKELEDDNADYTHEYTPYLADPSAQTDPYGSKDKYLLPFVGGSNVIVYEAKASNGLITTKTMVIYVEDKPLDWDLQYQVNYQEDTENAHYADIRPEANDGTVLELYTGNSKYYVQGENCFREYGEGTYRPYFVNGYFEYDKTVENKTYCMIDALGNVSLKTLTVYGSDGEVLKFDNTPPAYTAFTVGGDPLESDRSASGNTFHAYLYSYDMESWMNISDLYLTFDAEYSNILTGYGTIDEEGRLTMQVPVALDENGEPLKDEKGDYVVWESMDPKYNGIYRTRIREYGPQSENDNPGNVDVEIWLTWKYDESLTSTTRTIWPSAADSYGNIDVGKGISFNPSYTYDGYTLGVGALAERENTQKEITQTVILDNALNDDGIVGIYSTVPFSSISGWGVGEAQEIEFYGDRYNFSGEIWAPEGRYYYYTAPMIYKDGYYDFEVVDVFGQNDIITVEVDVFGESGVDASFSTTNPTNQPVTVYFEAVNDNYALVSVTADNGTTGVLSEDAMNGHITVAENCTITVETEYGDAYRFRVTNIDKELEPASIVYYDQNYRPLNLELGASEVIAVMTCTETVFATNGEETYVFTAGSARGDTYTFEYSDLAGNTGTVTATLPVDLITFEDDEDDTYDTAEADVTMGLYAYRSGSYELYERMRNPGQNSESGESELTAVLTANPLKAQKFRLSMTIEEESAYKVIVLPAGSDAPYSYGSATEGCTVDGIAMTSDRNTVVLEITQNTEFDVYVIDECDNLASFNNISIGSISTKAPVLVPVYETTVNEAGETVIKAVFQFADDADRNEVITPLTTGIQSMQTEDGIRYYCIFNGNGSFVFEYMDAAGNRGSAAAQVNALSTESAVVTSVSWFGTKDKDGRHNVAPDQSVKVNKNITAQLRMSKPISDAALYWYDDEHAENIGDRLSETDAAELSFTAGIITVTYTDSVNKKLVIRYKASESGRYGTYVLPEIDCIDKNVPNVTWKAKLSDDKQSILFTFVTDKETAFSFDSVESLRNGDRFAEKHTWTAKEAVPVTLYFTDIAGNQASVVISEFNGLDRLVLDAVYSASSDGGAPTDNPVQDLKLSVGGAFYIKVNKSAQGILGGTAYDLPADAWTKVTLPAATGIHILKLTDKNTGKVTYESVCALPKDNVAPVIEFTSDTVLVYETDSADTMMQMIRSGVTVTDNNDSQPGYTVTGYPASPAEGGLFTLVYTASDASGNKSAAERTLYIMDEDTPILWIDGEVGLPYGKVFAEGGEIELTMQNIAEDQPVIIKYRKGLYTTGQMKYYAETVENMMFTVNEIGHYTIYVRMQDRSEFVTYLYVEG